MEETKRHNAAMEKLQQARDHWNKKRIERIDNINETLKKEQHSVATLKDVNQAMQEYFIVTGQKLNQLGPEPHLFDFYKPNEDQQTHELLFVTVGLGATGLLA